MSSTLAPLVRNFVKDAQSSFQQYEVENFGRKSVYCLVAAIVLYSSSYVTYQLYINPLSVIPGPKLAALTYLYEAYFEVWLGGQYFKHVAELHKKYGPVVRITPNEIHFNDPEFLDTIYPGPRRKTNKPVWFALRTGTPYSIVSTPGHDLHRRRRNALNSFFSVASIRRLEPIIRKHMEKMLSRMEVSGKTGEIVHMHHVFKACASDVITVYAFDDSFEYMNEPDYGRSFFESTDIFFYLTHIFGLVPGLVDFAQNAPGWLLKIFIPNLQQLRERQDWWIERVREIKSSPNPERVKSTIFEGILNSSSLPPEEKTDHRLASEAQLTVFAGEGTTAYSLTCALYHLLAKPAEAQKLKDELAAVGLHRNEIPSIAQVDSLPYLSAIIQEAVRLHPGVMARQVRISPEVPIVYKDKFKGKQYVIPPETVTSMSPLDTHMHRDAFGDDAYEFRPQRWIDNPKLARYFHGFARGARNCVGMTLARREMAIILAALFLKYEVYHGQQGPTLELYNTQRARDIDANADYIIPVPAKGSEGLRVKIRS
ncbi:hypothetical protein OCU04_007422 [Sclerotinia nivalis]|uniref:Cytochrome P450 n=1 Tax=Sclerotinia nivalis TaxID=352851 RepID=A0A9X0AIZ5_9HELO|nr:hypothetical protein OCU04_007422 [Sclerotinia nivalis]